MKFGECELLTCNPDGSYTYTFEVTNLSNFPATAVEFHAVTPPTALINPNPYPLSPPLPPGSSRQVTVTIGPGLPGGTNLCFTLGIHDLEGINCCSGIRRCVTLKPCAPVKPACPTGVCCGGAPHIHAGDFAGFIGKRLAVATGAATVPINSSSTIQSQAVVQIVDLTETSWSLNANVAPPRYYGPAAKRWTHSNLGTVFGITLDGSGNIFVTATSAYNGDFYPAPGTYPSGAIWRLDTLTGMPTVYAELPNFSDPNLAALFPGNLNETFPALGDISYDCRYDQFFVTNLEDGKIYRLKSGNSSNLTGTTASTFDPFSPDDGKPGFAPLGERLLAVKVNNTNNRVYYSVWRQDCGNPGNATDFNEIWSVGLNASTGDFVPGDNRLELQLPHLDPSGGEHFSNPVFDISFSQSGNMLLAERTMHCDPLNTSPRTPSNAKCYLGPVPAYAAATLTAAHASRVLEYICNADHPGWTANVPFTFVSGSTSTTLPYRYNVGNFVNAPQQCPLAPAFQPANAAGGIDYDYSSGPKYTVWATGDSLLPYAGSVGTPPFYVPYGLQGFQPTGGGMQMLNGPTTAIAIDLNGIMLPYPNQFSDKSQIGDVEIVCPPTDTINSTPNGQ